MRSAAFIVVFMASAVPAFAHHGGGTFDLTRSVTYTGKLTRVELVNPHSWLYFDVTDPDGRVSHHRCEMRSVHVLRRSGWTSELFPVGQPITVEAAPDKVDPSSCYLNTIRFENGSHIDRYGQYVKAAEGEIREVRGPLVVPNTARQLRRPTGEPNISGDWAAEQVVMVDPRGTGGGMVPLSQLGQLKPGERPVGAGGGRRGAGTGPRLYGGTELTDLGQQQAASFAQKDNPRFRCETTSIVFDWTFDGAVNRITQNKDTILLQYRTDGAQANDLHEHEAAPGQHQADSRRSLDRPVGGRCAGRGYGGFHAGRAERAGAPRRQAARRRALPARSQNDEADALLRG